MIGASAAFLSFAGFISSQKSFISCLRRPKTTSFHLTVPEKSFPSELEPLPQLLEHHSKSQSRAGFLICLASIPLTANAIGVDDNNKQPSARDESLSGFVAGAALTITKTAIKYPLDTATVRLQMPGSTYTIRNLYALFNDCYNGVSVPLVSNIPAGAVFFAVKDATKASLASWEGSRWMKTCIAVAVAQFPYWAVRNPSEVVKTRQQAGVEGYAGNNTSPLRAIQQVQKDYWEEPRDENSRTNSLGVLNAFYRGYWENILYAYPADVIKFVCYDQLTQGRKNLPPKEGALAGAFATAIAQCVTTPLDVVRNRIMTKQQGNTPTVSYIDALSQLAKTEGIPGLFAGVTPRIGKAFISGAIQFATYEETKQEVAKLLQRKTT